MKGGCGTISYFTVSDIGKEGNRFPALYKVGFRLALPRFEQNNIVWKNFRSTAKMEPKQEDAIRSSHDQSC